MRRYWLLFLVIALAGNAFAAESIKVAAAADLNYAMNELADRFQAATGTKVLLSFGSSGNLFSQIQNGAPFDLFFSADEDYPQEAGSRRFDGCRDSAHLCDWTPGVVGAEYFGARSEQVADEPSGGDFSVSKFRLPIRNTHLMDERRWLRWNTMA